jgi:site-specific recombinase XerD
MQRNLANGFTPKTLEFYRCQLTGLIRFLTACQVMQVNQVRPPHLWSYLAALAECGPKDTSVHAAARAMRTFFNFCAVQDLLYASPMNSVEMPRLARRILPSFPSQSLPRLIAACARTRNRAIVLFLLDTGCRASELLHLPWSDLDLTTGRVVIWAGKGRKDRVVFVGQGTRSLPPTAWNVGWRRVRTAHSGWIIMGGIR